MQVTYDPINDKLVKEFFTAETKAKVYQKMDDRLKILEKSGQKPVLRTRIGRNTTCPCGSGLKFKKCCINRAM